MRIFTVLLTIMIVFTTVVCVYGSVDNDNSRYYSPIAHVERIVDGFSEMIPLEILGEIWNDNVFHPLLYRKYGMLYTFPYTSWNAASGTPMINAFLVIPDRQANGQVTDWGVFNVVKEIINGMSLFTYKLLYTLQWSGLLIGDIVQNMTVINPSNGMVERGQA